MEVATEINKLTKAKSSGPDPKIIKNILDIIVEPMVLSLTGLY
jgi:hypothetical protein